MRTAISYDSVQEFILEHDLDENSSIVLHPRDYDIVASEFADENNIVIFRSFEILGVPVLEDNADEVKKNSIAILQLAAS
ncbi:hypothetical protein R1T16_05750 [Flavobacterium sp. DG1-102-2]|uniref:hypothetical protein n=1 Tax=Flavobacterium sp. DG1-102-2 TaxID=3081663 RepID=UPI0029497426|nr:hypothetical protein [Flavobacterium sp. DG1-102-2]MDV6167919.1 hypothetical protein [Flavobacterium sp. DG1-102-2]